MITRQPQENHFLSLITFSLIAACRRKGTEW